MKKLEDQVEEKVEGMVEHQLNFRERAMIIDAARAFCSQKEHGEYKNIIKLERVRRLLDHEEVLKFQEDLQEDANTKVREWGQHRNAWIEAQNALLDPKASPEAKAIAKKISDPGKAPTITKATQRGKTRRFLILPKIEVWIVECLKVMQWNPEISEDVEILFDKYAIKIED